MATNTAVAEIEVHPEPVQKKVQNDSLEEAAIALGLFVVKRQQESPFAVTNQRQIENFLSQKSGFPGGKLSLKGLKYEIEAAGGEIPIEGTDALLVMMDHPRDGLVPAVLVGERPYWIAADFKDAMTPQGYPTKDCQGLWTSRYFLDVIQKYYNNLPLGQGQRSTSYWIERKILVNDDGKPHTLQILVKHFKKH